MSPPKPVFLDLRHYADIGKRVSGSVQLTELPRLAEVLEEGGSAEFELHFTRGENRRVLINGWIKAELELQCQRCLSAVTIPVDREIRLVVVEGLDEAEQLPVEVDPLLIDVETRIRLNDLLEDELLLALPQVAMHAYGECTLAIEPIAAAESKRVDEEAAESSNSFAKLAELKQKKP